MEKKTYKITFMADLTEDDVRAMNKCFYDAMNESMGIEQLWELKLEEIKDDPEPNPDCDQITLFDEYKPTLEELLMRPLRHINDVKACFEACESKADVKKVIKMTPSMFGTWELEFDDEYRIFTVINGYEDDEGYYEEEYCYDYPDTWEVTEEDDD